MSYERPHYQRGGGRRRHHQRDEYDDHKREETPEQKTKSAIIKLGEVDAVEELPRLAAQLVQKPYNIPAIVEGFRVGVTEQPYKIPFYAALLHILHQGEEEADTSQLSIGRQVLDEFWRAFQAFLDKLAWRETRYCLHFFAHLTVAGIISPESMLSLLQSFTAVLEEFGASYGRAKRAALCAAEGMMIAGKILKQTAPDRVLTVVESIQAYNETIMASKWIVEPNACLFSDSDNSLEQNADEVVRAAFSALQRLDSENFSSDLDNFLRPYMSYATISSPNFSLFCLPSILVPPEIIEVDGLSTGTGEDPQVKKEEWPEHFLRLFDNTVTPDPRISCGYIVKSALLDIIDIFEVNRKECARLLLEYPKWTVPGTFKVRPGAPPEVDPIPEKDWQLESTIIETIIGAYLRLPETTYKSVYYVSLITELCKLSPSTVGPAVGKTIRKLYSFLSDGLDVELSRRFAEWFSVHMSNFGFQWVWKEWLPDLTLDIDHPRRVFMRRAIEFEIRLSYHDRIAKTLPPTMQEPDSHVISQNAPAPNFEYEDPARPHHEAAQSVLNLFRGRAKAEDVVSHLDAIKHTLETSDDDGMLNTTRVLRSIVVQSLLHVGSRSFSHLLNALERYLPLLRNIANPAPDGGGSIDNKEAKSDILGAVAAFWKYNRHMVGIVFDKLMQYQIVDPTDMIAWTFEHGWQIGGEGVAGLRAFEWDLLKGALDKAIGRVMVATRKLNNLRKDDDERKARAKASGGDMEVDQDFKPDNSAGDNPQLETAMKAFNSLLREQKAALSGALDGFVTCLATTSSFSTPSSGLVISEVQWSNRAEWSSPDWIAWETWGWYRQFCRSYSPFLRNYQATLSTVAFAKLEGSVEPAAELVRKIWSVGIGQES